MIIGDTFKIDCLADAPKIANLIFRGFQGESDYANILKVISGSKDADKIERTDTLENIANYYSHLTNCDPYQDMLFAEVASEVVGYSRVAWNLNEEGQWLGFHLGFLLPGYRRQGIGSAMLCFNEDRLKEISLRLLDEGSLQFTTPTFYEAYADEGEVGKAILLTRNGYQPVRYEYSMERSLGDPIEVPPMPAGLEVRPAQCLSTIELFGKPLMKHSAIIGVTSRKQKRTYSVGRMNQPSTPTCGRLPGMGNR